MHPIAEKSKIHAKIKNIFAQRNSQRLEKLIINIKNKELCDFFRSSLIQHLKVCIKEDNNVAFFKSALETIDFLKLSNKTYEDGYLNLLQTSIYNKKPEFYFLIKEMFPKNGNINSFSILFSVAYEYDFYYDLFKIEKNKNMEQFLSGLYLSNKQSEKLFQFGLDQLSDESKFNIFISNITGSIYTEKNQENLLFFLKMAKLNNFIDKCHDYIIYKVNHKYDSENYLTFYQKTKFIIDLEHKLPNKNFNNVKIKI